MLQEYTEGIRVDFSRTAAKMNETQNMSEFFIKTGMYNYSNKAFHDVTKSIYSYVTPIIFGIGLIGNIISLKVFNSPAIKRMPASVYLSCLALADSSVLVFYVLSEWIRRGLPWLLPDTNFSILDVNGACQIREYLSHLSRLLASWIIVAFTAERCLTVCYPLMTLQTNPKRVLLVMFIVCLLSMTYALIINAPHSFGEFIVCSSRDGYSYVHFIAESMFATLIFFLPFVIITLCNGMILHSLYHRNRSGIRTNDDSNIRLEFIFILFAISVFYISFHIPYFIVWCRLQIITNPASPARDNEFWYYWNGMLFICRPIYYLNYCLNFVLYCITGTTFRTELMKIVPFKRNIYSSVPTRARRSRMGASLKTSVFLSPQTTNV